MSTRFHEVFARLKAKTLKLHCETYCAQLKGLRNINFKNIEHFNPVQRISCLDIDNSDY